jgi:hypothetical protein
MSGVLSSEEPVSKLFCWLEAHCVLSIVPQLLLVPVCFLTLLWYHKLVLIDSVTVEQVMVLQLLMVLVS